MKEPINQSINHSINQSINQSIDRSIDRSISGVRGEQNGISFILSLGERSDSNQFSCPLPKIFMTSYSSFFRPWTVKTCQCSQYSNN